MKLASCGRVVALAGCTLAACAESEISARSAFLTCPGDGVLDFGTIPEGTSEVRVLTCFNAGDTPLRVTSLSVLSGGTVFALRTEPSVVPARGEIAIRVLFSPPMPGSFTGQLEITNDSSNAPRRLIELRGRGLDVATIDGGVVIIDGGVQVSDGGVETIDGGVSPAQDGGFTYIELDGGVRYIDGGVVPVDGGVRNIDGGVVFIDGGGMFVDLGLPIVYDAGHAYIDGGVLFIDGGINSIYVDGGVATIDGGVVTNFLDGGVAYIDGGVLPVDGGPAFIDAGPMFVDGGVQTIDGGPIYVDGGIGPVISAECPNQHLLGTNIIWQEDFEQCQAFTSNGPWSASNGVWGFGRSPACQEGSCCTSPGLTMPYPNGTSSRLESPGIDLPTVSGQRLYVSFVHETNWFTQRGFVAGDGRLEVRAEVVADGGLAWGPWTELASYSGASAVSSATVELTAYAGRRVQVGWVHTGSWSDCCSGPTFGWRVDCVQIIRF